MKTQHFIAGSVLNLSQIIKMLHFWFKEIQICDYRCEILEAKIWI